LADPKKFRPKTAVAILADESSEKADLAVKAIALAELIAWSFLDQESRKKGKPKSPKKKRYIVTRTAVRTRSVTAAMLLDRQIKQGVAADVGGPLVALILVTGGFAALANGRSTKATLRKIRKTDVQARYVSEIVRYLVRCQAEPGGTKHATIDNAKEFVGKLGSELGLVPYKIRTITKFWETFAPAAPYIFALYQEPRFSPSSAKDPSFVLNWLTAFVSSTDRVRRLLGRAASALDLLQSSSRLQRPSDFTNIPRQELVVRPFNQIERTAHDKIVNADPKAPIYEAPYRPKVISSKRK
jgi:hypothetical protein